MTRSRRLCFAPILARTIQYQDKMIDYISSKYASFVVDNSKTSREIGDLERLSLRSPPPQNFGFRRNRSTYMTTQRLEFHATLQLLGEAVV
jgi:hypothetical protein